MEERRDAVVLAPVAVALQRPPTDKQAALVRAVEVVTRHLKGAVAALDQLREELQK